MGGQLQAEAGLAGGTAVAVPAEPSAPDILPPAEAPPLDNWAALAEARRLVAVMVAAASAAMLVLPPITGFSVAFGSFIAPYVLAASLAIFIPYLAWRRMQAFRAAIETSVLGMLVGLPTLVFTYVAMRLNLPLADKMLIGWDRALGFDWIFLLHRVDAQPALARALAVSYGSFSFQLLLLPAILCAFRQTLKAYRFVAAYLILCLISTGLAAFFPSEGAFVGYGYSGEDLAQVSTGFGTAFLASFAAVRADPTFVLTLENASGILTFPSVHAGAAILCAWGTWRIPLLRWPFLLLNLGMFTAALTHGAHYLVDLIAAIPVAALSIWLAGKIGRARGSAVAPASPQCAAESAIRAHAG